MHQNEAKLRKRTSLGSQAAVALRPRHDGPPIRSLPLSEWPGADHEAWIAACRPGQPLRRGGAASHLKLITRHDLQRRYGYFLDCLRRSGRLNLSVAAGAHTTPANIELYRAEIEARLSSVTVHGSVCKVRRATQLIAPTMDFGWLTA